MTAVTSLPAQMSPFLLQNLSRLTFELYYHIQHICGNVPLVVSRGHSGPYYHSESESTWLARTLLTENPPRLIYCLANSRNRFQPNADFYDPSPLIFFINTRMKKQAAVAWDRADVAVQLAAED